MIEVKHTSSSNRVKNVVFEASNFPSAPVTVISGDQIDGLRWDGMHNVRYSSGWNLGPDQRLVPGRLRGDALRQAVPPVPMDESVTLHFILAQA